MARTLEVYPKAVIGSDWAYTLKVLDYGTGIAEHFPHSIPAGASPPSQLVLLKIGFILVTADTDTNQDVDDALFVDDIRPGPQTETVWGNWQTAAEAIIAGGVTDEFEFWQAWSKQATQQVRQDANRALVIQRGWQITGFHQHEGDGTNTDG